MGSRDTLPVRIGRKREAIKKMDERIGQLMSQRVSLEEELADLLQQHNRIYGVGGEHGPQCSESCICQRAGEVL